MFWSGTTVFPLDSYGCHSLHQDKNTYISPKGRDAVWLVWRQVERHVSPFVVRFLQQCWKKKNRWQMTHHFFLTYLVKCNTEQFITWENILKFTSDVRSWQPDSCFFSFLSFFKLLSKWTVCITRSGFHLFFPPLSYFSFSLCPRSV